MARLPEGKQRFYPGVYYTMRPANNDSGLAIDIELHVKWYGYITLFVIGLWNRITQVKV